MRFVIITGMSGAGKTTVLHTLEDYGYFCVDNLPIGLLEKFAEISSDKSLETDKVAIGIDIRSGHLLNELAEVLIRLKANHFTYEIVFLDASDEVLLKRFKETRREHPLMRGGRIEDGITRERKEIDFLKQKADYIVDTSKLLTRELKREVEKIFLTEKKYSNIIVTVESFGYKNGIPKDADLVFDVRFLPNPYYDSNLKPLTGDDKSVQDYVMQNGDGEKFLEKLFDMLQFLIPQYIENEGKHQLVVAIGCTGGRHRSVTIANKLYEKLQSLSYSTRIYHRDKEKEAYIKGDL